MARRKCVCCGEWIGTDEVPIPYKNKYAHQKCFNIAIKAIQMDKAEQTARKKTDSKNKSSQTKPPIELKNAISEEEYAQKKQYYQYLKQLLDTDVLPAKVYALSNDFISKYGFSFYSMYQTLVYLHEIIEKELTGDIVGIIPFYHNDAQEYFNSIQEIEEKNYNIDASQLYQTKTIQIQTKRNKIKQLDIENIGRE